MSSRWKSVTIGRVLLVTTVVGFSVLLFGGYTIFRSKAPIPTRVVSDSGEELFGAAQIRGGQAVYQKYGLMDWGSVLGHGTYFGPDFTAEVLHRRVELIRASEAAALGAADYAALTEDQRAAVDERARAAIKRNGYRPEGDVLVLSDTDAAAFRQIESELRVRFTEGESDRGLPANLIREEHLADGDRTWVAEGDQIHQIAAFFFWTSWIAGAERPEVSLDDLHQQLALRSRGGGQHRRDQCSMLWSGISVAVLLLVLPLVILAYFKRPVLDGGRLSQGQASRRPGGESGCRSIRASARR